MSRLVLVLGLLVTLLVLPSLVKRIQYASEFGKQRARMDVALDGLKGLNLEKFSLASRAVANAVGPSVVRIQTRQELRQGRAGDKLSFPFDGHSPFEAEGQGSGVIIDTVGYVVTNQHVIQGNVEIDVILSDGRHRQARVVGGDPYTDIAVLKIPPGDLLAASWGDSEELETGDLVWAAGSPYGLERSVTLGIVSAKDREGNRQYQDFLQTDAAVNPGNSGGPLVNIRGEIVGINTAIWGRTYRGISFAVPSKTAREICDRLIATGKVARGWLGVGVEPTDSPLGKRLEVDKLRGALIVSVGRGSPGEQAGILPGDVISAWNEQAVDDPATLIRLVAGTEINSKAKVRVIRNGQTMTLEVVVGERKG